MGCTSQLVLRPNRLQRHPRQQVPHDRDLYLLPDETRGSTGHGTRRITQSPDEILHHLLGVLRASGQNQPSHFPPRVPPFRHDRVGLDGDEVLSRWSQHFPRCRQLFRPHCHVLLLLVDNLEARAEGEHLVEETHHATPTRKYPHVVVPSFQILHSSSSSSSSSSTASCSSNQTANTPRSPRT
jgi:hypothetical protein